MAALVIPDDFIRASWVEHWQLRNFRLDRTDAAKELAGIQPGRPARALQHGDLCIMLARRQTGGLPAKRAVRSDPNARLDFCHRPPRSLDDASHRSMIATMPFSSAA